MSIEKIDTKKIGQVSDHLYKGVTEIIDNARIRVAVYVNAHASMMFWNVGKYIVDDMEYQAYSAYGQKILATLSQTLTWSHFIELITIKDDTKRLFYQQMGIAGNQARIRSLACCCAARVTPNI